MESLRSCLESSLIRAANVCMSVRLRVQHSYENSYLLHISRGGDQYAGDAHNNISSMM